MARRTLGIAVVAVLAVLVGLSVARVRTELAPASAPPVASGAAVPSSISREQAITLARGRDVGRVDRIEAKLMTFEEYVQVAGPVRTHGGDPQASSSAGFGIMGDPAKRYVWVVAISGEVWPSGRTPVYWGGPPPVANPTPYPPYRWGLFLIDAGPGQLMAIGDAGVGETWPAAFDRLPDHPATSYVPPIASPLASPLAVRVFGPEAMSFVIRGAEVRRIDRIETKLMTRGEFELASPSGSTTLDLSAPLWVVAVGGEIAPQLARGATFTSATFLVDANSGLIVGLSASGDRWPAYFDALPNHATR
jgi:hypothetical protein